MCKLLSMASSCGATLFMTLMATWQLLLARYSRMEDIITLTTVANNLKRPDLDDVLGPFSNLVALRTDLSGEQPPTFFSLVHPCGIFLTQDELLIRAILEPMPNVLTAAACRRTNFQTAAWQGEGGDPERAGTFRAALQGSPGRIVAERRRCQGHAALPECAQPGGQQFSGQPARLQKGRTGCGAPAGEVALLHCLSSILVCIASLKHAPSTLQKAVECLCDCLEAEMCVCMRKVPKQRTLLDLDLFFYQVDNELQAELTYNAKVFEEETARRFADSLQVILMALASDLFGCGGAPVSCPCCRGLHCKSTPHTQGCHA